MRFWLLLLSLSASFAFAGVEVQQDKMSADVNSEPLRGIVDHLKRQSGITVTLDDSVAAERVTANFKDLTIATGIKKMLEGTGINYAVISEGSGKPTAIFIGSSERAGAGPKKIDARPVVNRSVVNPIPPPIPQVQQPMPNPVPQPQTGGAMQGGTVQPFGGAVTGGGMGTPVAPVQGTTFPPQRVPPGVKQPSSTPNTTPNNTTPNTVAPNTAFPTGGAFVPSINQPQVVQPKQPQVPPGNVIVPNDQQPDPDEEEDEADDESDEE
jgi:hypothetical protein